MRRSHERMKHMNRDRIRLIALLLSASMTAGAVSSAAVYAEGMESTAAAQETMATQAQSSPEETTTEWTEAVTEAAGDPLTEGETRSTIPGETETSAPADQTEAATGETETPSSETEAPSEETEPSTGETEPTTGETEPSTEETEPSTEETEPSTEETEPSTEEAEPTYPWDEMDDETFAAFIRDGQYLAYEGDEEAAASLLDRADRVEDEVLREELCAILFAWLFPEEAESDNLALFALSDAGPVSLEELNSSEMFFKQEVRGTCTLAANAMLVRRAARLNGYADWRSITESALRSTAWVEGVGMCWSYAYAGISVGHGFFQNCSVESFRAFLQQHPEGFVAYNANRPHAVLITDYDERTGIFYCADPGFANWRMPLSESILYAGSQEATIAGFTAYWAVTAPKLSLAPALPPLAERVVNLSATPTDDGVALGWNDTQAAGYWVYRSESADGPWQNPVYTAPSGTTSWTDENAQIGVTYYYRVCSFDSGGGKGYLSEAVSCIPDRQVAKLGQGDCTDTIRWIAYQDGLLLVMGSGALPDYTNEVQEPWLSIREKITEIRVSDGITYVGSSNFGGMVRLNRVTLPASVTSIGNWAFRGCSSLTQITMPGITSIGYAAFRHCTALAELEIPDAVSSIGDWAFSKCDSLVRVKLPASLKAVPDAAFYEDFALETVEIPSGVKSIGSHSFRGCGALRNVSIPSSVTQISSYAFALCYSLGDVDLSGCTGGLTLGEGAFFNCTGITRLNLPWCQVGNRAFAYCYGLRYVLLNQGGASSALGNESFNYCVNLNKFLALGNGINAAGSTFQNTAALVLVNSRYYGDLDSVVGQCRWRSYQSAGACSSQVQWYLDTRGNLVFYGSGEIPSYGAYGTPWNGTGAQKATVEREITGVGNFVFFNLPALGQITFQGSAPGFAASALAGVSGEVLYHNTDGSWTGKAGNLYGGSPDWRENHSYAWQLVKIPGFVSGGVLTGTCSVCGSSATVQVPKLDKESYDYVQTGTTARYTWKVNDYGVICFEVQLVTIKTQPSSVTVGAGGQAVFSLTASGNGLSYQWQRLDRGTITWVDCGTNSFALTLSGVTAEDTGSQFRCIVTDGNGASVTSDTVTLTVN